MELVIGAIPKPVAPGAPRSDRGRMSGRVGGRPRGVEPVRAGSMRLRLELFVADMDRAIGFYRDVLGFALLRREPDYCSLRHGEVVLGLGPIAKLPAAGGYFTRPRLTQERGLGVEIVLEVDDVRAAYDGVRDSGCPILGPLRDRPWGLTDFRLADPDGYYLRITSLGRSGGDPGAEDGAG